MSGVDEILPTASAVTRQRILDAIGRIVRAECQASGSPAFLSPLQPTLRTGTEALVAALA